MAISLKQLDEQKEFARGNVMDDLVSIIEMKAQRRKGSFPSFFYKFRDGSISWPVYCTGEEVHRDAMYPNDIMTQLRA